MSKLELIKSEILRNPLYRSEIPYTFQLGFPQMRAALEGLSLFYYPRRIVKQESFILFYPAQYSFVFSYPSLKLIAYSNLRYSSVQNFVDWNKPLCQIELTMNSGFLEKFRALWEAGDTALQIWESAKDCDQIDAYQNTFRRVMEEIGIVEPSDINP